MSFIPPNAKEIAKALGDITKLPKDMRVALTHSLQESFEPVSVDEFGWLNCHVEKGQTMRSFEENTQKAVPHGHQNAIFIQPVGSFDHPRAVSLEDLAKFTRAFYPGCDVELLRTANFNKDMIHRINSMSEQIQYRTDGFYNYLLRTRAQRNNKRELLCVAVTTADIYPNDEWNYVYGEASPDDCIGVYSFARLDPLFPKPLEQRQDVPLTENHRMIIARRCLKVLLHELGHLFGLGHCIYYNCLMNGTNHPTEMDQQTLHMCPVCLRKMHSTLQFDIRQRYEKLAKLCEKYGLKEEGSWYRKRLHYIQGDDDGQSTTYSN